MSKNKPDYNLYLSRNQNISWTEIDIDTALIDISTCCFYTLNEVGGLIWSLADGRNNLSVIVKAVISKYDVDKDTAENDIWKLSCKLVTENLAVFSKKIKKTPL